MEEQFKKAMNGEIPIAIEIKITFFQNNQLKLECPSTEDSKIICWYLELARDLVKIEGIKKGMKSQNGIVQVPAGAIPESLLKG